MLSLVLLKIKSIVKFEQHNDVHLWLIPVVDTISEDHFQLLSKAEQDRFARYRHEPDRLLFYSSHVAMRQILSAYISQKPEDIIYEFLEKGKPSFSDLEIQFNLSHSKHLAVLAITQNNIIGVDLEYTKQGIDFEDLANRFFNKNEAKKLRRAQEMQPSFYRCWTRKEAFIKALGEGLTYPLQNFQVSFLEDEQPELIAIGDDVSETTNWTMLNIDNLPSNYFGAIAVRKSEVEVTQFNFEW